MDALAPEGAIVVHPVEQGLQPFRSGAVEDVAAFGTVGDEAACFSTLRCWEMAPWVTPLPSVRSPTVISFVCTTRSNTARRVGSARVRMTRSIDCCWFMGIH